MQKYNCRFLEYVKFLRTLSAFSAYAGVTQVSVVLVPPASILLAILRNHLKSSLKDADEDEPIMTEFKEL